MDKITKLGRIVCDFNSMAAKHGDKSRLLYNGEGKLVLGREEQFQYGNYQALLATGIDQAITVANALSICRCFEYGE